MPQSWLNAIARWNKRGIYLPFVHDPQRNEPSVTLMFFYLTFILSMIFVSASSIILLIKNEPINATLMPTLLMLLGFVFYRLRNLDKIKIDLDDKEIELSSTDDEKEEK